MVAIVTMLVMMLPVRATVTSLVVAVTVVAAVAVTLLGRCRC